MTLRTLHASASPAALTGLSAPLGGFNPMLRGPMVALAPLEDGGGDDGGLLSFDDGVALLVEADEADDADDGEPGDDEDSDAEADGEDAEASAEDDDDEASDQEAGDEDAPDEDDPASEDDAEDEDGEPETPAIDPPKFWSAEEKALFAKAPPELQTLIAAKDEAAEKRVYAAKEDAATARKEASIIAQVKEAVDQQLQRAEQVFKGKWDGVDWAQWAKDDVAEYAQAKEEFEAEQRELDKLRTSAEATALEEHRQFIKAEAAKLADPEQGVPELADPVRGKDNKRQLVAMLQAEGFTPDDIKWIGARELKIAWKALQYDQIKARAAAKPPKPKPEPVKEPKPKAVKPAAAPAPRKAIAARKKSELFSRAIKSGRNDDAIAALMALEP